MLTLATRTTKSEGKAPLITKIRIGTQVVRFNLRLIVDITKWNEVSNAKTDIPLNNYLKKLGYYRKLQDIEYAIQELRRHHRLTRDSVEKAIQDVILTEIREQVAKGRALAKDIEKRSKNNIKTFLTEYVDGVANGLVRGSKGEKYSANSVRVWKQFRRIFIIFYDKRPFTWEDINQTVIDRFIAYLEDECGYMRSTNYRYISVFRTLVRIAEKKGLHNNYVAKALFHIPPVREQDKMKEIYLTKDELQALYEMKLEGLEDKVRDVFLIGCYTAQRFSDYSRIDEHCIATTTKGTRVINLVQVKTKVKVVVPILDSRLEALLKKYNYNVPNLNDVVFNRYIKEICQRLSQRMPSLARMERTKLTKVELAMQSKARKEGKEVFNYDEQGYPIKPRWQLVMSHTARRTAITNMFLSKKYTTGQMMHVSGHKKEKTFYDYVKLSLDEYADHIADASVDGLF